MAFVKLVKAVAFFLKCGVSGASIRSDGDSLRIPFRVPSRTPAGFPSSNCIPIVTPLGTVIFKLHTLSAALELIPPRFQHENDDAHSFFTSCRAFGDAYCTVKTHSGNTVDARDHRVLKKAVHNEFVFSCLAAQLQSLGYTDVPRHAVHTKTEMGDAYRWKFKEGGFGIQIEIFYSNRKMPVMPLRY